MVTTFIEFSDQLVIIQDNQNAALKWQQFKSVLKFKHNFHKEILKIF